MPKYRFLGGREKRKFSWVYSSSDQKKAEEFAEAMRSQGKRARVRKGGTKWDVFILE